MIEIYPSHYAAFHCIAGACPDSCCKEWEIVVDTASAERYRSVSGTLGERLRQAMITDADGDIVFQEHNSRCPFWNAQQLCDIHEELGEDALCETCRLFPRITQDYGDFIEFDISPACPEAARLLFSMTPKQWQLTERSSPAMTEEPPEYAAANMRRLQEQRQALFFRLQDDSASACAQLSACLTLAEQWAGVSQEPVAVPYMEEAVLSFLRSCEVLTSDWKQMLEHAANAPEPENLLAYKGYLMEYFKPKTVNLRIQAMNKYLDYIGKEKLRLKAVKVQQKNFLENVISNADYNFLKNQLKKDDNKEWYFVVWFLAATGARVSELIQIKIEHVEFGYFDLYSKGGKLRRLYIPKKLRDETIKWLAEENRSSGYLFLNRYGKKITVRGISQQLKNYAEKYGLDKKVVYPHSFRHRYAKNFLEKFNDIALLADLMGHESIETTRIYLRRTASEQQALVDKIVTW